MRIYFTVLTLFIIAKNYYCQNLKEIKIYEYGTQLKEKGFQKNGKREGRWQFYDRDEELSVEKDFNNDIEDGEWLAYERGKLVTRGTIKNGKSTGIWTFYFDNGSIYKTGMRIDGKQEGLWKRYYESGKIYLIGKYIHDKEDGVWRSFYEDGKIKSIWHYKYGKNTGFFQTLDQKGNLIEYGNYNLNNNETGKWRRAIKDYYEEGEYDNGRKIGLWKIIDSMGVLLETLFYITRSDEVNKVTYYRSGKIKETYDFVNFKRYQKYREYYEDGTVMTKGKYYFNFNIGMWKFYDKNGKLDHKVKHGNIREAIKSIKSAQEEVNLGFHRDSI